MDALWKTIREEVEQEARKEPMLTNFFHGAVLSHKSLEDALTFILASKLESTTVPAISMRDVLEEAFEN
ncbi:MAG: serine O-acetyltransferase, partial [Candidatus Hydrogenedentes bacterium]|nr:serine O-acetyltransferase [Candidatus Hydrogenedentota bacterium]